MNAHQLAQQLEVLEERLRLAMDAGRMGAWDWDVRTGDIHWSLNLEPLLGLPPGASLGSLTAVLESVHPDDRELVTQAIVRAFASGGDYRLEFRIVWPDGSVHWVTGSGRVVPDGAGQSGRMIGVGIHITERKLAEEALRRSETRLASIIASAMDAIITLDDGQRIVVFNAAAEKIFRCPASEALGQPIDRFLPERFRAVHGEHIRAFGRTGISKRSMAAAGPLAALRADGEEFPIEATISQTAVAGEKLYTVIIRDVSERKRAEAEQRRLEITLEHERNMLQTLARNVLAKPAEVAGLEVASIYEPASQTERVGGDFFDFIPLGPHLLGIVVGDVCGKGLTSAFYAITVRNMLRAYAWEDPDPREVVPRLNRALQYEISEEAAFVTLVYSVLDLEAETLTYVTAGHPPPVLYDPVSESCERLKLTGGIVGVTPHMAYTTRTVRIVPGAVLAFFTDGVTEAAGVVDPDEDGGVAAVLENSAGEGVDRIARAILQGARERAGGELRDDVAIVVIRRPGS